MVAALAGLVLIAVIALSAVLAAYVSSYAAGLMLGVGLVALAWGLSATSRRLNRRRVPAPGRSRTRDCRQARRSGPAKPFGAPRLPTGNQARSVPCPGSRRR